MKSESRVPSRYQKGTKDWQDQYDMLLPDGKKCGDCVHAKKCRLIFDGDDENDYCQFLPNKFNPKVNQ